MPERAPLPTIAIVAVHGVGDHEPGASAHAMADLLLRLRYPRGAARYTSFRERLLRIPTRPAAVGADTTPSDAAPEYALMRGQLARYRSAGRPYDTVRLDGERLSDAADGESRPTAAIHVYEMYWSDLSRVGASALRVFGEMYQLLFHLAVLGSLALRHAAADVPADAHGAKRWRRGVTLHDAAVQLLTAAVPATWLVMLATSLGLVVLQIPAAMKSVLLGAVAGAAVAAGVWRWVYRSRVVQGRPAYWFAIPASGLVAGGIAWWLAHAEEHASHRDVFILLAWLVVAGLLLRVVLRAYDRVRPGAWRAGRISAAFALVALIASALRFVPELFGVRDLHRLDNAVLNAFELETLVVVVVWYGLYACVALAALLQRSAMRAQPDAAAGRRLQRAAWTARATLTLSASSVLLFTFVLWAAILRASAALLPTTGAVPLEIWTPFHADSYEGIFHRIIEVTAGAGFPLLVLIMCVLVVATVLALLPAVAQDVWPPRVGADFSRPAQPAPAADADAGWTALGREGTLADRLGVWLSRGYERVVWAVGALFVAIFLLQPVVSILGWLAPFPATGASWLDAAGHAVVVALDWLRSEGYVVIARGGAALVGAAVGIVTLRGRFQKLALGFRPLLDAALDVDNYLREHPEENTPRARIAERYSSLLRYLGHWRGDDGKPYRAIVLVSHSQGTVITAEMLGWLGREADPELETLAPREGATALRPDRRLYLFTMGSPLRQLYGWCFPHLFGWLQERPRPWGDPRPLDPPSGERREISREWRTSGHEPDGHHVAGPALPDTLAPDPFSFGLARWVNAYRSGDYVGRALWRDEAAIPWLYRAAPDDVRTLCAGAAPPVIVVSEDAGGTRRELCIGSGAHTHYWDDTAHAVAAELDLLLAEAVKPMPAGRTSRGVTLPVDAAGVPATAAPGATEVRS